MRGLKVLHLQLKSTKFRKEAWILNLQIEDGGLDFKSTKSLHHPLGAHSSWSAFITKGELVKKGGILQRGRGFARTEAGY